MHDIPPGEAAPGTNAGTTSTLAMVPNKDLTGHKLLIISHHTIAPALLDRLQARFPGLKIVRSAVDPFTYLTEPLPNVTAEDWESITVVLTGPRLPAMGQAPKLQLVQLILAGANAVIKNPLFTETQIPFCTANGVASSPIAEWVICTYLAYQHGIPKYLEDMRDSKWGSSYSLDAPDAVGQRVGILGYGSIGRQIARVATALGMEVYAYTNSPRPTPESRRNYSYHTPGLGDPDGRLPSKWFSGTSEAAINEFLTSGLDLLVVAVPLTPQTHGILGAAQFKLLANKKTYVSNIGRGPTIVTDDLVTALDEGWIGGAALDVTDPEPLPKEHPLWTKKNVIITPHVSGNTLSYYDRLLAILEINLEKLSEGKTDFINQVSRAKGY
ncbi:D-isomer specific 2-hydroxyacid dehydrogenase [Xylaria sp. CBS 124048]|nr:D-isomer specific 2-hydroxyacid dehydrogenase [Xylaria sp. CBS 124048]